MSVRAAPPLAWENEEAGVCVGAEPDEVGFGAAIGIYWALSE